MAQGECSRLGNMPYASTYLDLLGKRREEPPSWEMSVFLEKQVYSRLVIIELFPIHPVRGLAAWPILAFVALLRHALDAPAQSSSPCQGAFRLPWLFPPASRRHSSSEIARKQCPTGGRVTWNTANQINFGGVHGHVPT